MSTTLIESMDNTHNPTVTITGGPTHERNMTVREKGRNVPVGNKIIDYIY